MQLDILFSCTVWRDKDARRFKRRMVAEKSWIRLAAIMIFYILCPDNVAYRYDTCIDAVFHLTHHTMIITEEYFVSQFGNGCVVIL